MYCSSARAGNDVGGLAAVGDDAVSHLAGRELLAQQPDRHLRHGDRVGGVDAQVRRDRRVRLPAEVGDLDLGQCQRARARDVDRARVQHHRGGDVVERSGLEQQHFSAAGLLGGGAEQHDRQAQVVGHLGQRQRRADRRGRDDVVAAGMSDAGQCVVFGADADHQRAAAEVGAKRGVQPAGRRGDLEAVLGDQRLRLRAALELGERQLRLGVDGVRQLDQVATAPVHCVFDADGGGGGGHLRSISLRAKLPNCDRSGGGSAAGRQPPSATAPGRRAQRRGDSRFGMGARGRRAGRSDGGGADGRAARLHPADGGGHGGDVISVRTGDHRVLVFVGRIHAYEGHDLRHVVHPCAPRARPVCGPWS